MFRRRLRLSAAAGASLLIAASAASLAPTQAVAAAAEENPMVDVAIDSFSPSTPVPGQPVTITGRVTNTSQTTFEASQATACIERDRLSTAAAIAGIPTEADVPVNDRNDCSGLTNPEATTFQEFDAPLAPKASVTFKLVVPWSEWKISSQPGVYSVGVRFRGNVSKTDRTTAGLTRILMPVISKTPMPGRVNAAVVLPLTHRPTLLADHLFANDSLAESMAPTGQLGRLLALGQRRLVTWLVDPAMIDEARTIAESDSYKVASGPGQTKAGTGRAVVKAWLDGFDKSRSVNQTVLLPYGDPDITSLAGASGPAGKNLINSARSTSERYNLRMPLSDEGNPSGLWLGDGQVDSKTLVAGSFGFAAQRDDDVNILPSSAWAANERPKLQPSPVYRVQTPEGPAPKFVKALIADSALLAGGPDPASAKQPLQLQQRFAAETSLLAGRAGTSTVVVVPPRGWDNDGLSTAAVLQSMATSPWITPVGVKQVTSLTAGQTKVPAAPVGTPGLSGGQLDKIQDLSASTTTYQALLPDPTAQTPASMSQGLLRSASLEWVNTPNEAQRFVNYQRNAVTNQLKKVHLVTNRNKGQHEGIKVNLSGSKGSFPLTVENGLDVTIRVGLEVTATGNRNDLKIDQLHTLLLPAGQKGTFQVKASAEQNGVINANAQLITAAKQPVGDSQPLVIQAAQYGSVGWILVGAAVALLFGTSIVRIYRRVRSERRNPTPKSEADALHPEPLALEDLGPAPDDPAANGSTNGVSRPESPAPLVPGQSDLESLKEGVGTKDG
ncbi:hypothetical protein OHA70_11430 [Kribbella sp. NBC_00382]|uniref:hypothetical protein n=1 Tax=Kribbella sp. NBC_00382 TaxID=2975967 RepID=UPI002E23ACA2